VSPFPSPMVDPLSLKALNNDNNQLATGASKAGSGWQESINDRRTTTVGNNEQQEHAADDDRSNNKGKGGKDDGDGNEGGRQ
jgi:hypothetical protein